MKISYVIAELQKVLDAHGDLLCELHGEVKSVKDAIRYAVKTPIHSVQVENIDANHAKCVLSSNDGLE